MSLLVGLILLIDALCISKEEKIEKAFLKRVFPLLVIFTLLSAWMIFQTISLSQSSPLSNPLWAETQKILGLSTPNSISLNPADTQQSLVLFLLYGSTFWLSARFSRRSKEAKIILKAFMFASALYATYGLFTYFLNLKSILWFDKWAYHNDVTSTFINRNTYATYAGLGVIVSLTVLFNTIGKQLHNRLSRKDLIRILVDNVTHQSWLPSLALLLNTTALLQSHSRGGFLSLLPALIFLIFGLVRIQLLPPKLLIIFFAIIASGGLFAMSMSSDLTVKRLSTTTFESALRDDVYLMTIKAIQENPLLGSGAGTFEEAFKAHKNNDTRLSYHNWDKAHNVYLEIAMENGLIATAIILVLFLLIFQRNTHALFNRKRRQIFPLGSATCLILVAGHSLIDFSMQIPGFTVSFLLLIGLGWAQSWPSQTQPKTELD
ncbi:O-antigen ligase family protein [Terasakiella pusilla]|uniref:O-antigen ligase family protein n=1 Tax=Terasakiella pusilla TaxID=64973 RepID=UPI003AA8E71F